ncbi:alpha-1,3-rhamnosyl/mannosyltransferase [Allopseudospirillum japonicum]|uniref:Alpha-1,3-rhamnosyl/mannosyltransferase n=1 Tax=Allopseudospirillum japonicum TaxID=64971 RepID=A0A1H6SWV8_9GAMM|nr:glycosyltransferase family 1 protein [Allopseudospirillum japonicum]SEI68052.1 alpha-1,3-rhamnosyl/mannosyltransferase [Allopseudospirillum japonicum]
MPESMPSPLSTTKVIINLDPLMNPLTGIGHYTRELLAQVLAHPEIEGTHFKLSGFAGHRQYTQAQLADLVTATQAATSAGQRPGWQQQVRTWIKKIPGSQSSYQRWLAWQSQQALQKADLYWEPNFIPVSLTRPFVPVVYDLAYLRYPELIHPSNLQRLQQQLPQALQQARRVQTISEFTRQELIQAFDLPPEKIDIIYPAVSAAFQPLTPEARTAISARYALPKQYVLALGTLEPRKNLSHLVRAYQALPEALQHAYPLVIVGGKGWQDSHLLADIQALEARGRARRLGYVPQADLPQVLGAASVLAYVSCYEGFGMPILEAMASGVPVLTANTSAMPEVAAHAAHWVDPFSITEITQGLRGLLEDASARAQLRHAGLARAADFHWAQSAQALKESWQNALS